MASLRMPRRALLSINSRSLYTPSSTISPIRPSLFKTPRHLQPQSKRPYHSTLHPRLPDHTYNNSQIAILTASLPHIPTHGFSPETLALGARDAGFLDVSVQLFPRAEFDLILFWLASRRGLLRAKVEEGALFRRVADDAGRDVSSFGVEEKCRILVMERLRMNVDVKEQWSGVSFKFFLLRCLRRLFWWEWRFDKDEFANIGFSWVGSCANVSSGEYTYFPD
jgi:ubiquinone biosynthesis protein COQ9